MERNPDDDEDAPPKTEFHIGVITTKRNWILYPYETGDYRVMLLRTLESSLEAGHVRQWKVEYANQ